MKRLIVFTLLMFCFANSYALDKRAPIGILPYKTESLRYVAVINSSDADMYNSVGAKISESSNILYGSKLIYRNTFIRNLEFAAEIPFIFEKDLESKSSSGAVKNTDTYGGIGDVDVALTYQLSDPGKNYFGAIAGVEVKFPTGNKGESRGTGSYDFVYRAALNKKIKNFQPFIQAIYTDSRTGEIDGIDTNAGDNLYVGLGTKMMLLKKFRLEFKYFYDFATTDIRRAQGGKLAEYDGYDIEGYRIRGELFLSKKIILESFYEQGKPKNHQYSVGNNTFTKEPAHRSRVAVGIRYLF